MGVDVMGGGVYCVVVCSLFSTYILGGIPECVVV